MHGVVDGDSEVVRPLLLHGVEQVGGVLGYREDPFRDIGEGHHHPVVELFLQLDGLLAVQLHLLVAVTRSLLQPK